MLSLMTSIIPKEYFVSDGYTTVMGKDISTNTRIDDSVSYMSSPVDVISDDSLTLDVLTVLHYITFLGGAFLNIFSFIIWQRNETKKMAGSLFFSCLSLCDAFLLLITFIDWKIHELYSNNYIPCAIINTSLSLANYSKYILAGISLERFIAVNFPLKANLILSTKKSFAYLIITFLLATVPTFSVDFHTLCTVCVWYQFLQHMFLFMLVSACNLSIIIRLAQTARKRREMQSRNQLQNDKKVSPTTVMLLTVSFGYIILTFPYYIYEIMINVFGLDWQLFWMGMAVLLAFNNNSCNFLLFYFGGTVFRKEVNHVLLQIFSCCRRKYKTPDVNINHQLEEGRNRVTTKF